MMRWLSTTFALGCLSFSGAAAEGSPNFYLLEYVAGVNWQQGLDFDDQRNSRAHYAYLEKLYANNILMMSGNFMIIIRIIKFVTCHIGEKLEEIILVFCRKISKLLKLLDVLNFGF